MDGADGSVRVGRFGRGRVAVAVLAVIVAGSVIALAVAGSNGRGEGGASRSFFAPYVDVTATPAYAFEDPVANPSATSVLSFVVSRSAGECEPTWGAYYTLDSAAVALDLDGRIARHRLRGGDVVVSFGGAINTELGVACTSVRELAGAYAKVVRRYDLTAIDLDIEGASLGDHVGPSSSVVRRAEAVRVVQRDRAKAGHPLDVWLTLPVMPSGLTVDGVAFVDAMLAAGVDVTGVNVMTMDYGTVGDGDTAMGEHAVAALRAVHDQLLDAYERAGAPLSPEDAWSKLGATPMIGQNDIASEVFRPDDATELVDFARSVSLGRLSFWSANRDRSCPEGRVAAVEVNCSGIEQEPLGFATTFAVVGTRSGARRPSNLGARGRTTAGASAGASASTFPGTAVPAATATPVVPGGAARSPSPPTTIGTIDQWHPTWAAPTAYPTGGRVAWRGVVYEAKWWTQGEMPDAPVAHPWDSPWTVVGLVDPSATTSTVPPDAPAPGGFPLWAADRAYPAGSRVRWSGRAFEAKWWTQGEVPQAGAGNPWDTPWEIVAPVP